MRSTGGQKNTQTTQGCVLHECKPIHLLSEPLNWPTSCPRAEFHGASQPNSLCSSNGGLPAFIVILNRCTCSKFCRAFNSAVTNQRQMQTAKVNMTGRLHHLLARLQDVQDMRMHMALATLLLLWEALFCFFIIRKVPCASQAVLYGKSN
jgi:hypothetical protein